jgi:ATP-dependent RNA helicase RhlE
MSFSSLGLAAELLRAVSEQGYSEPTPVQSQAIPVILSGRDVLAGAQTGTGKTAGFTLPMLHRLNANRPAGRQRPVRALVLTPTRELAAQVRESVIAYGKYLPLKSAAIFGGVGFRPQVDALRRGVDILVATPGRLLDHVEQRTLDLSQVEMLVLDEADRMLDMGFIHAIRKIISLLPAGRQSLLFSATFSGEIRSLAESILKNPSHIEVARRNATAERISHVVHPVDRDRKRELLSYMIGAQNWQQVLVFTRTKHGADRLADQLERDGLKTAAIHGNKSQGARTRALADFKRGAVRVLVATDIAARGIDIDQLPHVVNYELPHVPEDYVHRIGRTGRAGMAGTAISLVSADERKQLKDIERLLKQELSKVVLPGYEPSAAAQADYGRSDARGGRPQRGGGEGRDGRRPQGQPPRGRGASTGGYGQGGDRRGAGAGGHHHGHGGQGRGAGSSHGGQGGQGRGAGSSHGGHGGQGRGASGSSHGGQGRGAGGNHSNHGNHGNGPSRARNGNRPAARSEGHRGGRSGGAYAR